MDDFETVFAGFKNTVQAFHEQLLPFSFFAMVLGLLLAAYRGMFGNLAEILRALIAIAVLSVALNYVDDWTFRLGNIINDYIIVEMDTDPRETHTRFGELIADPISEGEERSWFDLIFDTNATISQWRAEALIWIASKVTWIIVWWAYMIHKAILYLGVGLAPIFLPMIMLNATRGISTRYLLGLFSLLLWPLGWATANLMTQALMEAAADRTLFEYGGVAGKAIYGPQMIFFILLASIWLVASTIGAPFIITRVLTTGSQIGAALLGGFAGSVLGGASGAVGGGMTGGAAGAVAGAGAGFGAGAVGGPGSGMAAGAGMAAYSMGGGGGGASGGSGGGGSSSGDTGGGAGGGASSGGGGSSSGGGGDSGGGASDYDGQAAAIAEKATSKS